ncbi:unnamed protein product, partial [Brenthis ino]
MLGPLKYIIESNIVTQVSSNSDYKCSENQDRMRETKAGSRCAAKHRLRGFPAQSYELRREHMHVICI